jgi:hypothetical protein
MLRIQHRYACCCNLKELFLIEIGLPNKNSFLRFSKAILIYSGHKNPNNSYRHITDF